MFTTKAGEPVRLNDRGYYKKQEVVNHTIQLSAQVNTATTIKHIREKLSEVTGNKVHNSTTAFIPFYKNFGQFITIGKRVFINHACSFLNMGGIALIDDVLIGPKVNLVTENHPLERTDRRGLICKTIHIRRNAGAAAIILPGVYGRRERCSRSRGGCFQGCACKYCCWRNSG